VLSGWRVKTLFPIMVSVLGHSKGGGVNFQFPLACGGGMDVFCYDPFYQIYTFLYIHTI
jgi:hypothetical protein